MKRLSTATALALVAALATRAHGATPVRAASCSGASHQVELADGTVSPGARTPTTRFAFSVTYRDNAGCTPSSVVVTIIGLDVFDMAAAGPAPGGGTLFRPEMTLPAGSYLRPRSSA